MTENSYTSARKDAIRAAAALGAGYLAYKGYKKMSSWDADGCVEYAVGIACLPSIVGTAALFAPYYIFWRARVYGRAERRLAALEPTLEELSRQLIVRKQELEDLAVKSHEIEEQLEPLQKKWNKEWTQACQEAAYFLMVLENESRKLARQRSDLLKDSSSYDRTVLVEILKRSDLQAQLLQERGKELAETYRVSPADSLFLFDEFVSQHQVPLSISFFLMFIPVIILFFV